MSNDNGSHLQQIGDLVKEKISNKLIAYKSETNYTPFFSAIFDDGIILNASLMQSLYTSFGMSIYEQMAVILAKNSGNQAQRQYKLTGQIDDKTSLLIDRLCESETPDKDKEINLIRRSIQPGKPVSDKEGVVDVFVLYPDGKELYVDITTVKPNLKEFRALRKKMLRWVALRLSIDKNANIDTRIGIPYNPYYPNDYLRWTSNELSSKDLLIQNDLWEAFAGYDAFDDIINTFSTVGHELKEEIDNFLKSRDIT